jgi:hypothetical protein
MSVASWLEVLLLLKSKAVDAELGIIDCCSNETTFAQDPTGNAARSMISVQFDSFGDR